MKKVLIGLTALGVLLVGCGGVSQEDSGAGEAAVDRATSSTTERPTPSTTEVDSSNVLKAEPFFEALFLENDGSAAMGLSSPLSPAFARAQFIHGATLAEGSSMQSDSTFRIEADGEELVVEFDHPSDSSLDWTQRMSSFEFDDDGLLTTYEVDGEPLVTDSGGVMEKCGVLFSVYGAKASTDSGVWVVVETDNTAGVETVEQSYTSYFRGADGIQTEENFEVFATNDAFPGSVAYSLYNFPAGTLPGTLILKVAMGDDYTSDCSVFGYELTVGE